MLNPRERRRSPRVTSEFPLRYRKIPVIQPGYHVAWVEDLSADGVRFRCNDDIRVQSSLLFELLIPGAQPVHSFGRAAWVRELPGHDGFEVGGKLEDQSTSVRRAIVQYLQREHASVGH
jgi:hypothetical protein